MIIGKARENVLFVGVMDGRVKEETVELLVLQEGTKLLKICINEIEDVLGLAHFSQGSCIARSRIVAYHNEGLLLEFFSVIACRRFFCIRFLDRVIIMGDEAPCDAAACRNRDFCMRGWHLESDVISGRGAALKRAI